MTRLAKFEEAGPPEERPRDQKVSMRLRGGRTGKRAVVCEGLELTGLMSRSTSRCCTASGWRCSGSNGSGKSHFLRLLAARRDRSRHRAPAGRRRGDPAGRAHRRGPARRAGPARLVRADARAPGADRADAAGDPAPRRRRTATAWAASRRPRALDRYELAAGREQTFESLSGGQQARFQILLLELSGATLLLLDEPTDNLDLHSAEALEEGLGRVRGDGHRGHPRPLVRARLRPVPRLRRRRRGLRARRAGLGRGPGRQGALSGREGRSAERPGRSAPAAPGGHACPQGPALGPPRAASGPDVIDWRDRSEPARSAAGKLCTESPW